MLVSAADNDGASSLSSNPSAIVTTQTVTGNDGQSNNGSASGAGAANGTPASETATLHLKAGKATHCSYNKHALKVIRCSYTKRAITLEGALTTSLGQPIGGATLQVLQQVTGSTTTTLLNQIKTSPNGTFTATIPAGPSRRIKIAYRAYTADPAYAATGSVVESVEAGVELHVNNHYTSPTGTVVFKGRVTGAIPPLGAIVDLLVKYHGQWVTIRTPRTEHDGNFHITYQWQGSTGSYAFLVEIPAGQANYPYTNGHSNTINITST